MFRNQRMEPASPAMAAAADDFFDLLYIKRDFVTAMRKYADPSFIEHNPDLPNDPMEQVRWFEQRHAANPEFYASHEDWNTNFVHKFTVGEYLIIHYFMSVGPTDKGRMFADFWRFSGEKIVEHWDVVQPVPEKTESGNTMW